MTLEGMVTFISALWPTILWFLCALIVQDYHKIDWHDSNFILFAWSLVGWPVIFVADIYNLIERSEK